MKMNCLSVFRAHLLVVMFVTVLFSKNCQTNRTGELEGDQLIPDDKTVIELNDRVTKTVSNLGYKLTSYETISHDDYIIKIHRLVKEEENLKSPVLIMHGIHSCSVGFFVNKNSLAYYLAGRGYDVWVANARGTVFSLKHKTLNREQKEYWKFSFHEMGYYDLPAMFHKIKQVTGASRVHYVGYSMGTTAFLAMACTQSSVLQDYVGSVTLVAPIALPRNYMFINTAARQNILTSAFKGVGYVGHGEFFGYSKLLSQAIANTCSYRLTGWLCVRFLNLLSNGKKPLDHESMVAMFPYFPCGASVQTHLHYIQIVKADKFQQYDYGEENQMKYKQSSPLEYDLKSIDKKMYLLVGGRDTKADKTDIKWLHEQLRESVYISDKFQGFDHWDFEFGTDITVVNEVVFEIIQATEEKRDPRITGDQP